jgi:hypothetical protein
MSTMHLGRWRARSTAIPKTLTLSKHTLKSIASESQSGVDTRTSDSKIEFYPNYKFASTSSRLLHPMWVIQPLIDCLKQCSSIYPYGGLMSSRHCWHWQSRTTLTNIAHVSGRHTRSLMCRWHCTRLPISPQHCQSKPFLMFSCLWLFKWKSFLEICCSKIVWLI